MDAVQIQDLSVAYQKNIVLSNVDINIPKGKLVGIIGPNGAGKSTLIKSMINIIPKISGEIQILGKPYKSQKNKVGYVPQKEEVDWSFPTNVLDVVLMGRYRHAGFWRRPNKEDVKIAKACIEKVGLTGYENRQISELSGGQQQRTFLARALAQDTSIYLMDEPFTGVDAKTERSIVQLMKEMKDEGKTVIVVHHDLQTVQDYFDWLILLNQTVIESGPTEEVYSLENIEKTYGGSLEASKSR